MANRKIAITVRGHRHRWAFIFLGDPADIPAWEADGLEVAEVVNTIPAWVPAQYVRLWCRMQDIFNFKWRE